MELKVGFKLKDNDPRETGRVLTVTALGQRTENGLLNVHARGAAGPEVRISVHRIYSDGKPRRSGFDLVGDDFGEEHRADDTAADPAPSDRPQGV
ncbi:MAG: hypothetical protein ACYCZ6_18205 [Polaromonas sp.]